MFLSALDVPAPERAAWLAAECHGDDALRRRVEALLAQHEALVGDSDPLPPADVDDAAPDAIGEYRVLGTLGHGGMGVVYRARRGDEPPVALKVLRPGLLTTDLLVRFRREAEMLARLDHPGIARLVASGVVEGPDGLQPFLAMRLVEGPHLRAWAAGEHPLEDRLELLARICDAVQHAHTQGVIHRDLKPENVVVREGDAPCVLDFGVARLTESDYRATTLRTSAGVLVGTLRYMSPEQADAAPGRVGPRSDVYSLGVLAYEVVAGEPPYDLPEHSLHGAIATVLTAPPRPLDDALGRRRAALEAVLGKALAKAPEGRYADPAALAADLRRIAAGRPPHARLARRGPPVAQVAAVLALAALAAFALGRWAGGFSWLRSAAPTLDSPASRLRDAVAALDSAAAIVHAHGATPDSLLASVALCDRARARVGAGDRREPAGLVRRLAWTLAMEAHLRLGQDLVEPGEYEACIAAGRAVLEESPVQPGPLPAMSRELLAHLADQRFAEPRGPMALAASRLGLYSDPVAQQRRALAWNAEALAALAVPAHATDDLVDPNPDEIVAARAALVGERVIMLARLASLTDSLATIREAERLFATLSPAPLVPGEPDGRWLLRAGFLASVAARLERDPARFDSAVARLRAAAAYRREDDASALGLAARIQASETLRWCAQARAARAAARRDLAAARAEADAAYAMALAYANGRPAALARLQQSLVALDLAVLDGSTAGAEAASRALAAADSAFPPITFPALAAEIATERARAGAFLWSRSGDRFLREAAERRLADARRLRPDEEAPSQGRRLDAGLLALSDSKRAPADLWFPVPAGPVSPGELASLQRRRRAP